ncbi:unnamed protein product [Calypogeia fissa]
MPGAFMELEGGGEHDCNNEISFVLNGELVTVEDPDPSLSLGDFLRRERGLKGLQQPCRQGGCGACTVLLSSPPEFHAKTGAGGGDGGSEKSGAGAKLPFHRPVNSCLRPLCSVDGMTVTTVEGVGNTKTGLHPVQEQLVKANGTQCGFCTSGMIMSMYGLLKETPEPTQQQVEDQLDGNLCRCTGYRPILDGFQTFSYEGESSLGCNEGQKLCAGRSCGDIEESNFSSGSFRGQPTKVLTSKDGKTWMRVSSLAHLYSVLRKGRRRGGVRMIRGNTGTGIYEPPKAKVLVDISCIPELSHIAVHENGIIVGGAVPITDFMLVLENNINKSPSYAPILTHFRRVAHPQVRNIGSVAGNLALCHAHPTFPSDAATVLMAAEARLRLGHAERFGVEQMVTLKEFFQMSLQNVVILEVHIPVAMPTTQFITFKVALRRVNAHAILNAGFKFDVDSDTGVFKSPPVIVYGGVKPYPQRASQTESYLLGKSYRDAGVFEQAAQILASEMVVDPSLGKAQYRTRLIEAFFYKAMLSLWPVESIPPSLRSSVEGYVRPISTGDISFDEGDPSIYPVSKPLPKLSASLQATGEAIYLDDIDIPGELHSVLVLSTVASATIKGIDPSKALAKKGVKAFLSAASIAADGFCNLASEDEEVFASSLVKYYSQPVGLIVATSKEIADSAAKLVDVEYIDIQPAILTIEDAISANSFYDQRGVDWQAGLPQSALEGSDIIVEGQVSTSHQYHFHLETQRALCVPSEGQVMKVYSSTQNPSLVQHCVGVGINKAQHKVEVIVKRVGGAFGSKLNRSSAVAMACAYAAEKLQKPVRLVLDLATNMQSVGARSPYLCKYKIGVQKDGRINVVKMEILNNQGAHFDYEYPDLSLLNTWIDNTYNILNWDIQGKVARTNLPAMTYMRGPVFVETMFIIETVIEHVASVLGLRPDVVREVNMYKEGDVTAAGQKLVYCNAKTVFDTVKESSDYEERYEAVEEFNASNKWVKRGISVVPCKFLAYWEDQAQNALVNIYPDGSISLHTSGCEVGQGLDIKIAQVAASTLGVLAEECISPQDIRVHTTSSGVMANNVAGSGGSVTSEIAAAAVQDACQQIVDRLQEVSKAMLRTRRTKPTWEELIGVASDSMMDLQGRARISPGAARNGPYQYVSFGAAVTEAEVDVLTGDTRILRCDLLLDCGKSLNPAIDIGQVQGAFVQGLGYFLTEEFVFDDDSGKLLSDGTWDYKPPSSKDIPHDFRTALLANSGNPSGFLRSKFSGEPPYALAAGAIFAVRQAISSVRAEFGNDTWCSLNSPATVEKVVLAAGLPPSILSFKDLR